MPFCKNCGSPVEGQFCAKCGTPLAAPAQAPYTPPAPPEQSYGQPGGQAPQPAPAAATGMTENVAGLLCYILGFITGILFLALAPYNQSKFVRFHAFQSIFYNIALFAIWVAYAIIGTILTAIMPFGLGLLWGLVSLVVWLGTMAVWVILMVKAYQNQKWSLPIIGALAEKQA